MLLENPTMLPWPPRSYIILGLLCFPNLSSSLFLQASLLLLLLSGVLQPQSFWWPVCCLSSGVSSNLTSSERTSICRVKQGVAGWLPLPSNHEAASAEHGLIDQNKWKLNIYAGHVYLQSRLKRKKECEYWMPALDMLLHKILFCSHWHWLWGISAQNSRRGFVYNWKELGQNAHVEEATLITLIHCSIFESISIIQWRSMT